MNKAVGLDRKELIRAIKRGNYVGGSSQLLTDGCSAFGANHIAFVAFKLRHLTSTMPYLKLTYPTKWVSHYAANNYMAHDPVIEGSLQSIDTLNWDALDWRGDLRQRIRKESQEYLGRSGATIPVHGALGDRALLSFTTDLSVDAWREYLRVAERDMIEFSAFFLRTILAEEGLHVPAGLKPLSPRERAVLQLCAFGMKTAAVAKALKITDRTARAYFETAQGKLGAANRYHAISRAIGLGLIDAAGWDPADVKGEAPAKY